MSGLSRWLRETLDPDLRKARELDELEAKRAVEEEMREARAAKQAARERRKAARAAAAEAKRVKEERYRAEWREATERRRAEKEAAQRAAEAAREAAHAKAEATVGPIALELGYLLMRHRRPEVLDADLPDGHFECDRCGRWADLAATVAELPETVRYVGLSPEQLAQLGQRRISPAVLQRELGMNYDDAARVVELGSRALLFYSDAKGGLSIIATMQTCAQCLASARDQPAKRDKTRDSIPPRLRFRVLQRDHFRCKYCGRSPDDGITLHVDHIVPVADGGETEEGNLQTACSDCNLGKSDLAVL